jgi:thioredoxin 1
MPVYQVTMPKQLSQVDHRSLVVIDFYAEWCQPCKRISPKIESMSDSFPDVLFFKIDVEDPDMETTVKEFEITAMPTFVLVRNRAVVTRVMGADENALRNAIQKYMN